MTPIATVRTIHLDQTDTGKFVWNYDDDETPYSGEFDTADSAKSWLFTPVAVDATTKPDIKV
jgi:hypothetical protein